MVGKLKTPAHILVVDDEAAVRAALAQGLREAGYEVSEAASRASLMKRLDSDPRVHLITLDLMLGNENGLLLARQIRSRCNVPIVMITGRSAPIDRVTGLEHGADDYIVKPFKPKELIARVRARMRRLDPEVPETLSIGDLRIDVAGHAVTRQGKRVSLTPLEFDLLVCLARKPWQVFTREVLLEEVWGYRHAADTRLVNVHVQRLRSKVERDPENPEIVVTVRGVGYKAGA